MGDTDNTDLTDSFFLFDNNYINSYLWDILFTLSTLVSQAPPLSETNLNNTHKFCPQIKVFGDTDDTDLTDSFFCSILIILIPICGINYSHYPH